MNFVEDLTECLISGFHRDPDVIQWIRARWFPARLRLELVIWLHSNRRAAPHLVFDDVKAQALRWPSWQPAWNWGIVVQSQTNWMAIGFVESRALPLGYAAMWRSRTDSVRNPNFWPFFSPFQKKNFVEDPSEHVIGQFQPNPQWISPPLGWFKSSAAAVIRDDLTIPLNPA